MDWAQSLRIVAPEELLSVAGLVLLLGSAWAKTARDARAITWLAVALFFNGFAIAPLVINAYGVAEGAVPPEQITETLT